MKSPRNLAMVTLAVAVGLLSACEKTSPQTYTIGVLSQDPILEPAITGFKEGMVALHRDDGPKIQYAYDGPIFDDPRALAASAKRLVSARVDVILSVGTQPTQYAQEAAARSSIPIVFSVVDDPVGAGFIESTAHPGGSITGTSYLGLQEAPRLRWLLELVPGAKRIYVPCDPANQGTAGSLQRVRDAAERLGVTLVIREVHGSEELTAAIEQIPLDVDAILLPPDTFISSPIEVWAATAIERKLPLCVSSPVQVRRGALMSYGFSFFESGTLAAHLADQVLRGASTGDLPVEVPEFFLSVNVKTAEAIGLDIPNEILCQADDIIR